MTSEVNSTTFEVIYGDKAYENNKMDAKILGNALFSLASLIENSDKILNGEDASPQLIVKTHKEGSFTVILEAVDISINTMRALGLISTSGVACASIWAALDILRGKMIHNVIIDDKNKTTKLIIDEEEILCTEDVKKLVTNKNIRKEIEKLVCSPLSTRHPASFVLKNNNNEITKITQSNVKNFQSKALLMLSETEYHEEEINVKFYQPNFESPKGWGIILPQGETMKVSMNDNAFLERVNKNIARFSKDDLFVVLLKKEIIKNDNVITKTSYSIERVIRHRVAEENKII